MPIVVTQIDAAAGAGTSAGRRPTVVPAPAATSPELTDRPRRRTFTVQDKLRILAETDRAADSGRIGAILRREGLYSSILTDWRRQRDAGAFGALVPARRGRKTPEPNPLTADVVLLQRENVRLRLRLTRAEAIIDLQKKLCGRPPGGKAFRLSLRQIYPARRGLCRRSGGREVSGRS